MLLGWASLLLCALHLPLVAVGPAAAPAQDKAGQPPAAAAASQPRQRQGEEAQEPAEPRGHPHPLAPQRRSRGLVQNIDQLYSGGGKVGYLVYAGGRRFLLDLERDDSVGAAGFVPAGGGPSATRRHRGHCFYRGTVDGSPRSLAVFDLCGGLRGFFAVKHARYTLKPLLSWPWSEAESGRVYGDGSARILHVYTREGFSFEALPPRTSCETPGSPPRPRERPPQHNSPNRRWTLAPQLSDQAPSSDGSQGPQTWWRRRRRSISRARQVELLLVADASMARMYGRGLQHYLLTLASIANRLYSHASIENHIRLTVVKVVVLGDKDKTLEVSKNAATTLKNFCKWQHQHNQLGDDHEEHYDAAILFTREVGPAW